MATGSLRRAVAPAVLIIIASLGSVACGSIDPAPFAEFHAATERLAAGSEEMFELGSEWARKGYLTDASVFDETGDLTKIALVQDTHDSLAVEVRDATPYLAVLRAGKTSRRLNRAFVEYAELLSRLASGKLLPDDAIEALASDLHEHLGDVAAEAGLDVPDRALLSTAAAGAFEAYLEGRRRADLVAALTEAQPSVEAWARLGEDATERLGGDLYAEYLTERRRRMDDYARTSVDSKRKTAANAVLTLTETMLDAYASLRALRRAYGEVPKAHADLIDAARGTGDEGSAGRLHALRAFAADVRRLGKLRDELAKDAAK